MQKCHAVIYEERGEPLEVLRVGEIDVEAPAAHEVLVRMLAAPINPVDLNVIEGKYAVRPPLPAVAGSEGVGEIVARGNEVSDLEIGTRVLVPHEFGSWREFGVIDAQKLTAVPPEIPVDQAAMMNINPPTAWRMLHDFVALKDGDWILQNAANSSVGHAVIHLAKARGWRTLNVVRRPELIEELRAEGGDMVLLDDEELPAKIKDATDGVKVHLALNAVGGDSALRLANALAENGTIVTYGAMGRQPVRIPNGLLIFKNLHVRGFWITRWYRETERSDVQEMFNALFPLAVQGILDAKIEKTYPLDEAIAAVEHSQKSRRGGKILLQISA